MLNNSGITKTTLTAPQQILANVEHQVSVGCVVAQAAGIVEGTKTIVKAGTPVAGNLDARTTPFTAASSTDTSIAGVYTVQITTAATAGDKITVEGVEYEHAAAEDVATKKFSGATAAEQVTSLLKMVVCEKFVVGAVAGATNKIKLTQKIPEISGIPAVTSTKAEGTGTIVTGNVVEVTPPASGLLSSDAVGVILHDVDVTAGNANATLLVFGFVNMNRLDAVTRAKITAPVKAALKVTFMSV